MTLQFYKHDLIAGTHEAFTAEVVWHSYGNYELADGRCLQVFDTLPEFSTPPEEPNYTLT